MSDVERQYLKTKSTSSVVANVYLTQSFRNHQLLELFIRKSKCWRLVEEAGQQFVEKYKESKLAEDALSAIIVPLTFCYEEFVHQNQELLHFMLDEPIQFEGVVKYCIFGLIRIIIKTLYTDNESLSQNIDIDQVHLQLRLLNLPLQQDLCFEPSINLYRTGLSNMVGILAAISEPDKEVIQSLWFCSFGCSRNKVKSTANIAPNCLMCSRPMSEYAKLRYTQDYFLLRILPVTAVETPKKCNKIFRTIIVKTTKSSASGMEPCKNIDQSLSSLCEISASQMNNLLEFDEEIIGNTDDRKHLEESIVEKSPFKIDDQTTDAQLKFEPNSNIFNMSPQSMSIDNDLLLLPPSNNSAPLTPTINISSTCNVLGECSELLHNTQNKLEERSIYCSQDSFQFTIDGTVTKHSSDDEFELNLDRALNDVDFNQLNMLQSTEINRKEEIQGQSEIDSKQNTISSLPIKQLAISSCPVIGIQNTYEATNPLHFLTLCYSKTDTENIDKSLDIFLSSSKCSQDNINQNSIDDNDKQLRHQPNSDNSTADFTFLPMSVKQLYDVVKTQYSDFAFIYALSAQLCQDCIPMDCCIALKMALLLSIASISLNPDEPPIPIITIGNDTRVIHYLMNTVGQLASRFVCSVDDIKAPSSNGYRNSNWLEASPVLLATGGVYYVGDWLRLKSDTAEKLLKEIEYSTVTVDKSSKNYPLQTAIWTHWRASQYNAQDQQLFNKFVKIFGIPIYIGDDNHAALVSYTLEQSSLRAFESTVDHYSIGINDMRNFLMNVSQRTVDISPEASILLQKYFVASRVNKPGCLTKQACVVLKQFAESFARLSLRHEVLKKDAMAAIVLCEHFIQHIYTVERSSAPTFGAVNFIGIVDEYMEQFEKWLEDYIANHEI